MAVLLFPAFLALAKHLTTQPIALALALSFTYAVVGAIRRRYFHPLSHIPGPLMASMTGWYEAYYDVVTGGTYVKEYTWMYKRYGPVVRTSPNHVHVDNLEFYKKIFNIRTMYMKEPDFYGRLGASNSIVGIMDPDQHRVHRRLLNPMFSKRYIYTLSPLMAEKLEMAIRVMEERCQSRKPVDIQTLYRCITMEMISKALFGKSQDLLLSGDEEPSILAQLTLFVNDSGLIKHFPIVKHITKILPTVLGRTVLKGLAKFRAEARRWVQVVRQRRAQGLKYGENGHPTLFDILLESNVEKGYVVPPAEALIDQAFFFLMAGTDTTSYSLSCATYYVLSHDEVHKGLVEELVAAPRDQYGRFEYKVLAGLPYLSAVVKESLRLSTAVAGNIPRVVPEGGVIVDGYFLPAGTAVSVTHRTIHDNPNLFPQPENFDPLRWLGTNNKELDYWNVSFSKGPRRCLGMNLAYLEIYMCLATFILHFDMRLFETDERSMEWWDKGITVNRKHVKVVAIKRELVVRV
ncbi:cytochrome P450 [Mollisia scopiformis]|uniref:Cytochrome P450 n=1 Tax=Mollisia scopiformis TaxID=149040 RepID=A0A132B2J0_MOLSC|nr:cytochrome P450 [Mollisia scopiformis]KUJ06618.1 cytochrome P450 [Mollisia scopiformis]